MRKKCRFASVSIAGDFGIPRFFGVERRRFPLAAILGILPTTMKKILAFDIYGTLIDTSGIGEQLERLVGPSAKSAVKLWRDKQLEYSFRRGLMQRFADFSTCTREALDFTDEALNLNLAPTTKEGLLEAYRKLPAFGDAGEALEVAAEKEWTVVAFSNGGRKDVDALLENAGIRRFFSQIVSAEDTRTFKPSPAIYLDLARQSTASPFSCTLVSANPFDVIGAVSAGLKTVWVRRSSANVWDPWENCRPDFTVDSLAKLGRILDASREVR